MYVCMYACLCEHTGDPLQSRVKEIQSLTLTRGCWCLSSTVMLSIHLLHVTSSLLMVSLLCLHASHRSSPTRLTACLTPTPRYGAVCTAHTACSTLHDVIACLCGHQHSSPLEAPHPTPDHYWLLLLFSVTMDSFLYSTVVAMSCPSHVLFAICFCLIPAYSVWVRPIQQALAKIPLVTVFRGGHFCVTVPCLYHLQQSFNVQTYNMGHCWHWEQCLGCKCWGCHYIRLAVTLCNGQFAVLHSGAFVWSTSQHQKDWATLGFPWLVFRVCVWGCPLCLYAADMQMVYCIWS